MIFHELVLLMLENSGKFWQPKTQYTSILYFLFHELSVVFLGNFLGQYYQFITLLIIIITIKKVCVSKKFWVLNDQIITVPLENLKSKWYFTSQTIVFVSEWVNMDHVVSQTGQIEMI